MYHRRVAATQARTDGRRLCRPLLTRAGHRTHDTHEGFFVRVAPGAGGAIPCGYGGHIGDRREGGSGCVFFVHALSLFYVVKMPQATGRKNCSFAKTARRAPLSPKPQPTQKKKCASVLPCSSGPYAAAGQITITR